MVCWPQRAHRKSIPARLRPPTIGGRLPSHVRDGHGASVEAEPESSAVCLQCAGRGERAHCCSDEGPPSRVYSQGASALSSAVNTSSNCILAQRTRSQGLAHRTRCSGQRDWRAACGTTSCDQRRRSGWRCTEAEARRPQCCCCQEAAVGRRHHGRHLSQAANIRLRAADAHRCRGRRASEWR